MTRPVSSYRLQLSPEFTLHDALEALPYLDRLGVDHLYLSPVLQARPGSAHGYDVADPTRVSRELGGEDALRALAGEAIGRGMGLIADIVPNHMAADESNPWWWDVLRLGRESAHAVSFDIDWDAPGADGRLVLPVLGEPVGEALEAGTLAMVDGADGPLVGYHDRRFPLTPGTEQLARKDLGAALEAQRYRLCFWRAGLDRLNYRRFFDVSDLAALRADDPEVFRRSHELLLRLVGEGVLQGLRVDHVDGLADPAAYLRRLREAAPDAYLVVEKILAPEEQLPADWPVDGTTGYEFLGLAGGVFIDREGAETIAADYVSATGRPAGFEETALRAKREALDRLFGPDAVRVLRRAEAAGLGAAEDLARPLAALTVHLDVYRTYADAEGLPGSDRSRLERAAGASADEADAEAVRRLAGAVAAPERATLPFVQGWQQLTGPVAAKGVEDTALYRDARLLARNEPGLDPSFMSASTAQLHEWCASQAGRHPMTTTSTHDTKRGEDVRSRIAALALVPDRWRAFWNRWRDTALTGADASADWLALQTLAGSYVPEEGGRYSDRIEQYLVKALREAKEATSWLDPDEAYEQRMAGRVRERLSDPAFAEALAELSGELARLGAAISVGQLVAKLIAPGCPDIYWGNERERLTLVDPDNRGPVDFRANGRLLAELERRHREDAAGLTAELGEEPQDGRLKLLVTHVGLRLRRTRRPLFMHGRYVAVDAGEDVYAAARQHDGRWVLAVAALRPGRPVPGTQLGGGGLPRGWRDLLTGGHVDLPETTAAALLGSLPATLLDAA